MPNFSAWGGGEGQPEALAALIPLKPVSTGSITRGDGSTVAAKTVRLETLGSQQQRQSPGGQVYMIDAMVLGIMGTDLRSGDIFTVDGQNFEVVIKMPGHTDCEQYYLQLRR